MTWGGGGRGTVQRMRATPDRAPPRHRRRRWLALLCSLLLLASVAGLAAAWTAFERLGRTPAELLDYAEQRLAGHPRIEAIAGFGVDLLRARLDAPRAAERALRFTVPPPPPRRGRTEVPAPEPAPAGATVWRVGPGQPLARIADAARQARDGDVVEILAGDYRGDVAVWMQKRLTIRGVGGAARLFAEGRDAEGKAIWVIRNGDFDIRNIDFIGTRVADGNGAGIRFEGGHLRLRDCLFWDNQMGLLTSGDERAPGTTLHITSSEFAYSHVHGRWGHNLYVGPIASLQVTGSWFHHAGVGHLLKSRARVSTLHYNRFTDETGGRASYELDFPNGGEVRLVGNIVQQQPRTENGRMVAYGEEGYRWPVNILQMASNTFVNDLPYGGTFVHVAPGATSVLSANNLRVGPGADHIEAPLTVVNDHHASAADFRDAAHHDYGLRNPDASWRHAPIVGPMATALTPNARYVHPRATQALAGAPAFVGAQPAPP